MSIIKNSDGVYYPYQAINFTLEPVQTSIPLESTTVSDSISSTILNITPSPTTTTTTTQITPPIRSNSINKFPYPVLAIVLIWIILTLLYIFFRWKQKGKIPYIIPRVFVLCSPRTVQYHYELILRIGLPSYDFNPEKHDIDITILGQQKNEVVPMTRLNTKTLLDEPLITSLSIVVYRLVELPQLKYLLLKHSGPFKSWVFAYDFTIIDLSTNKEQYFTLNKFIGALNRMMSLDEPSLNNVHYPIDDVPLPKWSNEDTFLYLFIVINTIMFSISIMPINCNYPYDLLSIFITSFGAITLVFFLEWLFYYFIKWDQERKEFFNDYQSFKCLLSNEYILKIIILILSILIGGFAIYNSIQIFDWQDSLIWFLCILNSSLIVIGVWNAFKQAELGELIVNLGLKFRGVETIGIGMKHSEMISNNLQSRSGSTSDDGISSSSIIGGALLSGKLGSGINNANINSRVAMNIGPRSSVKSFGFEAFNNNFNNKALIGGSGGGGVGSGAGFQQSNINNKESALSETLNSTRLSSTGATPNNQTIPRSINRKPDFGRSQTIGNSTSSTPSIISNSNNSSTKVSQLSNNDMKNSNASKTGASHKSVGQINTTTNASSDTNAGNKIKSPNITKQITNPTQTTALLSNPSPSPTTTIINSNPNLRRSNRHIKFADPLATHHNYEKLNTVKSEIADKKVESKTSLVQKSIKSESGKHDPKLAELQPPFTLVAHLDIAAHKLNARNKNKQIDKDKDKDKELVITDKEKDKSKGKSLKK